MFGNSSGRNAGEMQLSSEIWKREKSETGGVRRAEEKIAQSHTEVCSVVGGVWVAGDQEHQYGLEKNLQVVETV